MALLETVLFPPADYRRTTWSTIGWWEKRRLTYNVVVGGTGLVTFAFVRIVSMLVWGPRESVPFGAALVYGLAANVCYSFGWCLELALNRLMRGRAPHIGPALFRQGLAFSLGLTLLPILLVTFGAIGTTIARLLR